MKIIIQIFIFIYFVSAVYAETIVYIETNRENSKIYINDDCIGTGSVIVKLDEGEYKIKVREDALKWNSRIIRETVKISERNESLRFSYNFENQFFIDTNPQDSPVYSGDSLLGRTPLLIDNSFEELQFLKNDFAEKKINGNSIHSIKPIELNFTGPEKSEKFVGSGLFWGLIGSAVALGTTAAYFKIKADNNYEDYLDTGNRDLLNKTNDQDIFSGVSFGALQLNLGLILYLILTE